MKLSQFKLYPDFLLWYEDGSEIKPGRVRSIVKFPDHKDLHRLEWGVVLDDGVLLKQDAVVHPRYGRYSLCPPPHSKDRHASHFIEERINFPSDRTKWMDSYMLLSKQVGCHE